VLLSIGGERYGGWTSVRISRGLEQVSGSFDFGVSERFDGVARPRPIRKGMAASVLLGSMQVMQGFTDVVAPQYDAQTHGLSVSGRDATGDLVDCAAICKSSSWNNRTMAQIASDLCAPFKVPVKVLADVGPTFAQWQIEPGETVIDNMDRMARYRGVLLLSDGLGSLLITQPGAAAAAGSLVLGQNIRSGSGQSSMQQRFSEYLVKAQQAGSDTTFGAIAAGPSASVMDPTVGRYRPTVIMAEDQGNPTTCKLRAQWQRTVAAARSEQITYTVDGWTANGKLWQPNTLVPVNDSFMGINETRLISQVVFTLDEQGKRTEISVVGRHAYDPIKLPQPPAHGGLW
jgi:prophage tail gpP-like protein